VSEDDTFRQAMSDVAPLQTKQRVRNRGGFRGATPAQLERREAALGNRDRTDPNPLTLGEVPQLQPQEVVEWKKDGVQHRVYSRFKAGKYPLEGSLDLHRKNVKEARIEVFRFFGLAMSKGWRTVIIAHGKGERSTTPARIKSYVAAWLGEIPEVIAYCSAQKHHGGAGAVYVMLKKAPAAKEDNRQQYGTRGEASD
jgi:DNA-nicking Smr family endonuclease